MELSSEQWCSLSGLYTAEEADFMAQLLGSCQVPSDPIMYGNFNLEIPSSSSSLWSRHQSKTAATTNLHFPRNAVDNNYNNDISSFSQPSSSIAHFYNSIEEPENKRNVKSRKKQKTCFTSNIEEDGNGGHQEKACEELNAEGGSSSLIPQDSTGLKLKGKSRSNRGSTTDPQCIYAKKRRERINERLKILQSLVPNGTKVDISTMLEEAVQYVKFLQLQIKLLSSDDLWMYSPIAYNGMNIGLDLNITPTKQT